MTRDLVIGDHVLVVIGEPPQRGFIVEMIVRLGPTSGHDRVYWTVFPKGAKVPLAIHLDGEGTVWVRGEDADGPEAKALLAARAL